MVQMFCGLFLINPIGQYINRHTHEWWEEGSLWSRLYSYQYYIILVALVGGIIMFFVDKSPNTEVSLLTGGALLIMVISGTWNATLIPMLNMLGLRGFSVSFSVFTVGLSLLASIPLIQKFPTATAWFFGQSLGMFAGAVGAGIVLFKLANTNISIRSYNSNYGLINKKDFLIYCLPLAIGTGFMWLQLSGYRLIVESYWGLAQLGFITVGLLLASQVWGIAESLVVQFLYPYFFKRVSRNDVVSGSQALSDLLNIVGPLYLILAGITAIAAPLLVFLLVDEKFSSVVTFVMMGAVIESCRALANVFGNSAQVKKNTRSLIMPYVFGSTVLFSALFYIRVNDLDVFYVGLALVLAAISTLFIMILVMFIQIQFYLDWKRWMFGGVAMSMLFLSSYYWSVKFHDWISALALLAGVGIIWIGLSATLLWRNPALGRLLEVKLRTEGEK